MSQIGQAASVDDSLKLKLRLTTAKARVTTVIDGLTLIVNKADTINLSAIYIPWEYPDSQGEYGARAKKYLEDNLTDKFIRIYQVRNNDRALKNALGHDEGYIVREDGLFIQQDMVEKGLAFAYPSQSHNAVADILYAAEAKARIDKVGFWADDQWKIISADNANEAELNRFAIVEGTVKKVASRNNVIYLNFGDNWKDDFTVSMSSDLRRTFAKSNINVMQLGGQTIRARGWMRDYNGAYIEIFDPSQIEVIEISPLPLKEDQ